MRTERIRNRRPSNRIAPPPHSRTKRALAALAATALTSGFVVMTASTASANSVGDTVFPSVTAGFQIDGNLTAAAFGGTNQTGSLDWNSAAVAAQPLGKDPIGTLDTTVLSTGSKESDYGNWQMNTSAGTTPKGDIGNYYAYAKVFDLPDAATHPGLHLFVYFGIERLGNTGTVDYVIELNQKTTTHHSTGGVTIPDRTPGDLRLNIYNHGSEGLTLSGTSSEWTCTNPADVYPGPETSCGWSAEKDIPDGAISGLVNDASISNPFASDVSANQGGALDAEQFTEVGIDLTSLFGDHAIVPGCPNSATFGLLNLRSRASVSLSSEMKDIINPVPFRMPNLCADLLIKKVDGEDHLVPGATFLVTPNPATRTGTLTVVDGGTNDLTPQGAQAAPDGLVEFANAKPGSYTVSEIAPPPGWIGDPTPQTKQADADATTMFKFVNNLGGALWQKVDADTGEHLGGAKFFVTRTAGDGMQEDITVTDNGTDDLDYAAGYIKVIGLKTGTYTVTEIGAPDGYSLSAAATQNFTISAEHSFAELTTPFQDPRMVGYLHIVKKLVDVSNEPFSPTDLSQLDGTTFVVYRDANENGVLDPGEEAHLWPPAEVETVATGTITGGTGAVDIGPLAIGDYRIAETAGPRQTTSSGDVDVTVTQSSAQEPVTVYYTNRLSPLQITIVKSGPTTAHVGDTVTYTFTVTNSGLVDLHDVTVTDPGIDEGTLTQLTDGNGDLVLAVGETWTYSGTRVVQATDPDPLPNTATATGRDVQGRIASDTDDHVVDLIHPAVNIVKTADNTAPTVGDTVTFTFVVKNTGDTTLFGVKVIDDVLGAIGTVAELAPGASTTLTATEVVASTTPVTNVATVTGKDSLGKEVTDTDDATIAITIVNPPPPPPVTPTNPPAPETPKTGANVTQPASWALGFMLIGALSIAAGRRRERNAAVER